MLGRFSIISILILTILSTSLLVNCSSSDDEPDEVILQINWVHEAEFVGYYVAEAKGFYDDENIDITIVEGGPGVQARLHMLDGSADFAIAAISEHRDLVAAGEPAVAVMTAFQIPPLVMFSLTDSGIREPKDMVGKRVGIKNNYWRDVAHETLTNAGIDPSEIVEVEVEVGAQELLYNREVDVWMGFATSEPIEAQVLGYEVTNIYAADYGVGGYEGLLLVNQSTIEQESDMIGRFVRACQKGWQYAVEHPDEAAEILLLWQPDKSVEFQQLAIRAAIPLVDTPQAPIGWIDADRWQQLMGDAYSESMPGYTMEYMESVE